ncbi:MAG: hypothetical protein CM15mL5_2360 [uncultured marine virus]|nr:MAG: hypothetical protein CM15mL5_2360 [uncultured marine virus]
MASPNVTAVVAQTSRVKPTATRKSKKMVIVRGIQEYYLVAITMTYIRVMVQTILIIK